MFALFGAVGQGIYNSLDASHTAQVSKALTTSQAPERSFLQRLADKKWVPMKALSDEEYEGMLQEKLLRVEAELAILDEDIQKIKKEEACEVNKEGKV